MTWTTLGLIAMRYPGWRQATCVGSRLVLHARATLGRCLAPAPAWRAGRDVALWRPRPAGPRLRRAVPGRRDGHAAGRHGRGGRGRVPAVDRRHAGLRSVGRGGLVAPPPPALSAP